MADVYRIFGGGWGNKWMFRCRRARDIAGRAALDPAPQQAGCLAGLRG